jgi:hypothetical protein
MTIESAGDLIAENPISKVSRPSSFKCSFTDHTKSRLFPRLARFMHVSGLKTLPLTLVAFLRRVVYYSKHVDDGGIIIEVSLPQSLAPAPSLICIRGHFSASGEESRSPTRPR